MWISEEARECWVPWRGSYGQLETLRSGCLEQNSCPLEDQEVLLTTKRFSGTHKCPMACLGICVPSHLKKNVFHVAQDKINTAK